MPTVSVIMPAYNAERFLAEAIGSVLAQTYPDWELLLLNDGSTDGTRAVAQQFTDPRVRLVDNPGNLGLTRTLNRGIGLAQGRYLARLWPTRTGWPCKWRLWNNTRRWPSAAPGPTKLTRRAKPWGPCNSPWPTRKSRH
ncbi:MAG: glycosyltransferase [Bernardetiaceae bacterium]|nr:glycosyltransferase [Bernardetiaceae bacterium]